MNRMVTRAKQVPPRCLAGFRLRTDTEAAAAPITAFWGGTENAVGFELHGESSADRPVLLGHYLDKEWRDWPGRILVSPLVVRWVPSGQEVLLFDGSRHGYNPEYGLGRVHAASSNPLTEWIPPDGTGKDLLLVACFAYHPSDQGRMEADEVMSGHPQDFFETFLLAAYNESTQTPVFITEFECA